MAAPVKMTSATIDSRRVKPAERRAAAAPGPAAARLPAKSRLWPAGPGALPKNLDESEPIGPESPLKACARSHGARAAGSLLVGELAEAEAERNVR